MCIGILFESNEWSDLKLQSEIVNMGIPVNMFDMEKAINWDELLKCKLVISRVFASAVFRGHGKSLEKMQEVISNLKKIGIPMINPYNAHFYEINKSLTNDVLEKNNIPVPKIYEVVKDKCIKKEVEFPCILKPNCGGRTNFTYILRDKFELENTLKDLPDIEMILQEYIEPIFGFLTRIEVFGEECALILKRSIAANGLSSYSFGSNYTNYSNCRKEIKDVAVRTMKTLNIEVGSMDIIENEKEFYIIDVNSVSNTSEECTEIFKFDQMLETAKYIVEKYYKEISK